MRDFFHYFFGKGDEIEFKHFSLAHILPIIIAVVIIYFIYTYIINYKMINVKSENE